MKLTSAVALQVSECTIAFYLAAVALTWRGGLSRRALVAVLAVAALMNTWGQKGPDKMSETGSADTRAARAAVHKQSGIQLIATEEAFAIPSQAGVLINVRAARGC